MKADLIRKLIKLADEDENGTIDEFEFVHFVKLLKSAKIDIRDKVKVEEARVLKLEQEKEQERLKEIEE